jgi:hypothetical protein
MKICPVCSDTFVDEYNFCLHDGSLLGYASDLAEPKTVLKSPPQRVHTTRPEDRNKPL